MERESQITALYFMICLCKGKHFLVPPYPDVPADSTDRARFPVFTRPAAVKHALHEITHSATLAATGEGCGKPRGVIIRGGSRIISPWMKNTNLQVHLRFSLNWVCSSRQRAPVYHIALYCVAC